MAIVDETRVDVIFVLMKVVILAVVLAGCAWSLAETLMNC